MNFLTKSIAAIATAILMHSAVKSQEIANDKKITIQEIVSSLDGPKEIHQKLVEHSSLGKILSDYILVFEKLKIEDSLILESDIPVGVIPNYLGLVFFSEFKKGVFSQETKIAFQRLLKAHQQYDIMDESGYHFNMMEYILKSKSSSDPASRSLRLKNLRYVTQFEEEVLEIYLKKLKKAQGWVVNREVDFWKTQLDIGSCESAKRNNNCIFELIKIAPKKKYNKLVEIEKMFCEVKLISAGKITKISLCE